LPCSAWLRDAILSCALVVYYYRDLFSSGLETHLLDHFDQKSFIWSLEWLHHSVFGSGTLGELLNTNIFYPHKGTGAWSDMILGFIPLYSLFRAFSDNLILCLNLIALSLTFFSCLGILRISRLLVGRAAIISPLIGCVGLITAGQEGHIQMKSVAVVVWIALAVLKYHETGRPRYLGAACVLWATLFHCSIYLFLMTSYLSLLLIISAQATAPRATYRWLCAACRSLCTPRIAMSCALALSTVGVAVMKYLEAKELQGTYTLEEAVTYSGRFLSLLDAPKASLLFKPIYSDWGSHEAKLMFGVLTAFLALAGLALPAAVSEGRRVSSSLFRLVGYLVLISFILALGPYEKISFQDGVKIPLLGWLFWSYLPGFSAMRVAGRFATIGVLAIAILAEVGFWRMLSMCTAGSKRKLVATAVVALLTVEQASILPTYPITLIPHPRFYTTLGELLPGDAVLVELPLTLPNHFENIDWFLAQELSSTRHWRRLLIGYSSKTSPELSRAVSLWIAMRRDSAQTDSLMSYLKELRVSHIILNTDLMSSTEIEKTRTYLRRQGATVPLFQRKNKEVWELPLNAGT
jgi:hypothetical protein